MSRLVTSAGILVLLFLTTCSWLQPTSDPEEIKAMVAEAREGYVTLIRATLTEQQRANRFIQLVEERDDLLAETAQIVRTHRQKVTALNSDFHASRQAFEELLTEFNQQRAVGQRRYVTLLDEMKKETTEEEWKVLSEYQIKRLNPRWLTYKRTGSGG